MQAQKVANNFAKQLRLLPGRPKRFHTPRNKKPQQIMDLLRL